MREIPLTRGQVAIVDDGDYAELSRFRWHFISSGYAARTVKADKKKTTILMHRLVTDAEKGKVVDHISGDRLDNRRGNLRVTDQVGNQANRTNLGRNSSTGYKGVSWHKGGGKYEAGVSLRGKRHFLGLFVDKHEAARAYNVKALELFGEFARLNEIPDGGAAAL